MRLLVFVNFICQWKVGNIVYQLRQTIILGHWTQRYDYISNLYYNMYLFWKYVVGKLIFFCMYLLVFGRIYYFVYTYLCLLSTFVWIKDLGLYIKERKIYIYIYLFHHWKDMIQQFLVMLTRHSDASLRFLSFRLDFNEHYNTKEWRRRSLGSSLKTTRQK